MQISVYNNGQQLGPFPLDAVHNMVRLGSLPQTAHVWYEGAPDWIPLPTFLQQYPVPAAPAAPAGMPMRSAGPSHALPEMMAAARAQGAEAGQISDGQRLLRATIAGGIAALIGGGVWAGLAIGTSSEIGYVAWGIGLLCGFAVSKLGRGNGTIFQAMAAIFSLVGIAIGKLGFVMSAGSEFTIMDTLGVVDIVFVVFAVASAWQMAGGNKA